MGGMGKKNLKGGDFAPDDFAKDTSCGGHFRGGLVVVVVVMFYCRRLVCLMVGLMFGCTPASRWLGIGFFITGTGITNCVACGGSQNNSPS